MNRRHISSEQIWFLLTLYEERSLKQTSNTLHISNSTATRLLNGLRELFQDPLFIKGGEGMVPTAKTVELIPDLKKLQQDLINIIRPTHSFNPKEICTTIRMAGVDNATFAFLLPCLKQLYREAPGLKLSFVPLSDDFCHQLEKGRIDVAFYAPPLELSPEFKQIVLYTSDHEFIVRRGHPLVEKANNKKKLGQELSEEDFLEFREIAITYGTSEGVESKNPTNALTRGRGDMDCAYFLASAFLLLDTDFYTQLPVFTAEYLSKHLPLETLPKASWMKTPKWSARMIWHERTDSDPTLQWFRSLIIGKLKGINACDLAHSQALSELAA